MFIINMYIRVSPLCLYLSVLVRTLKFYEGSLLMISFLMLFFSLFFLFTKLIYHYLCSQVPIFCVEDDKFRFPNVIIIILRARCRYFIFFKSLGLSEYLLVLAKMYLCALRKMDSLQFNFYTSCVIEGDIESHICTLPGKL